MILSSFKALANFINITVTYCAKIMDGNVKEDRS